MTAELDLFDFNNRIYTNLCQIQIYPRVRKLMFDSSESVETNFSQFWHKYISCIYWGKIPNLRIRSSNLVIDYNYIFDAVHYSPWYFHSMNSSAVMQNEHSMSLYIITKIRCTQYKGNNVFWKIQLRLSQNSKFQTCILFDFQIYIIQVQWYKNKIRLVLVDE